TRLNTTSTSNLYTTDLSFIYSMCFFFFNDPATTYIYTLSLHDALPILSLSGRRSWGASPGASGPAARARSKPRADRSLIPRLARSEEHTSELQSRGHLVCRLLLEKKKYIVHILSSMVNVDLPSSVRDRR